MKGVEPMNSKLSLVGMKMSELTGVRAIMRDIAETIQNAKGAPLINLSAGNPVILPEVEEMWKKYTYELLDDTDVRFGEIVGRYGSSQGYEPLIQNVVQLMNSLYGWGITERNVLITPGSQSLYFLATNAFGGVTGQGGTRKIILPLCPDYTGYAGVVLSGGMLQSYKPHIEKVEPHRFKYRANLDMVQFDETIGAVLFSRPCNPSGNVLTDDEVSRLVDAAAKYEIPVFIDSAYGLPFPNISFVEMKPVWNENVIHCLSLSKAGLPGERIGIAIGSEKYIRVLESFQSNLSIHSSRYGQALVAKAIASGDLVKAARTIIGPYYKDKFDILEAALDSEMPDVPWYLHKGEGSVFAWLWLDGMPISDVELYRRLKEHKVIVVPGSSFFPGLNEEWQHKHECLRISLTATAEEIRRGMSVLSEVVGNVYREASANSK